jgi:uncharacterized LabA/DUF88 family protein
MGTVPGFCGFLLGRSRSKSNKYTVPSCPIAGKAFEDTTVNTIAVFADVQNIYYTTRQIYGRQFNYRALWERIAKNGEILSATAYAIDRGDDKQQKFQNALKQIGFTVKLKPFIQRSDGSAKGDWDVGITIDIMEAAPQVGTVVLLSGDGDFDMLMRKIKKDYGVRAEVYGVPALTADSLIRSCSEFHPIEEGLLL